MALKILIFGHNFVERARTYTREFHSTKLHLHESEFEICFYGVGGLTTEKAQDYLYRIEEHKPDIVLLDLGGNDLDQKNVRSNQVAKCVAAHLLLFAGEVLERARIVYIIAAYHRQRTRGDSYIGHVQMFIWGYYILV